MRALYLLALLLLIIYEFGVFVALVSAPVISSTWVTIDVLVLLILLGLLRKYWPRRPY